MSRLIDADALEPSEVYMNYGFTRIVYMDDIDEMPTIDAEPVIKCKDCKYNYANQIPSDDACQLCVELPISKDFFCAYGEKMDEVNDETKR